MKLPAFSRVLPCLALLLAFGAGHAQEPELLPAEEAFQLSARLDGETLVAVYRIAPGYYLYRERFDFQVEQSDAPARFGAASIPDGKVKQARAAPTSASVTRR